MKRTRLSIGMNLLATAVMVPLLHAGVHAADSSYDLFSWPKPEATYFCYVLVPASTGPVIAAELKATHGVTCGREQLKNQIIGLPEGSLITWKQDKAQGLTLPRPDVVRAIVGFSNQSDRKLVMQETPPPAK